MRKYSIQWNSYTVEPKNTGQLTYSYRTIRPVPQIFYISLLQTTVETGNRMDVTAYLISFNIKS